MTLAGGGLPSVIWAGCTNILATCVMEGGGGLERAACIRSKQARASIRASPCQGQVSVPTHRVIAELFLGGPEKETVNHKNGIKTDNRAENLEWATQRENNAHAVKTGLSKQRVKPVKRLSDGMTFDSLHEAAAYCNKSGW